jgi:hypothetical protein
VGGFNKLIKAERISQVVSQLSRALQNLPAAIEKALAAKILDIDKVTSLLE